MQWVAVRGSGAVSTEICCSEIHSGINKFLEVRGISMGSAPSEETPSTCTCSMQSKNFSNQRNSTYTIHTFH